MKPVGFLLAVMALLSAPLSPPSSSTETDRLATLGRVWGLVKYAHPRVAVGIGDWDTPVLSAVPAAISASDDRSFARVVDEMLRSLGDPLTRVIEPASERSQPRVGRGAPVIETRGQALLIDLRKVSSLDAIAQQLESSAAAMQASHVIVDVRALKDLGTSSWALSSSLQSYMVGAPLELPTLRSATVNAYRRQQTTNASTVVRPTPEARERRAVFIVDPSAVVPPVALSLRARGVASILAVGGLPESSEGVESIALPGGYVAQVRVQDFVISGKRVQLAADRTLDPSLSDDAVYAAASELSNTRSVMPPSIEDPPALEQSDDAYSATRYPSESHRVLAVYRLWGAIHYFFAYPHLMDRPWSESLSEFIPLIRSAKGELEYSKTIAEMAAWLQDNHVGVDGSPELQRWLGIAPQSAVIQFIEGKPVVTRLLAESPGGLQPGDEIVTIDGEPVGDRVARIQPYLSFSTPQGRDQLLAVRLLAGVRDTRSKVQVLRNGKTLEVSTSERGPTFRPAAQRDGEVVRVIDGDVGYIDLDRLQSQDVASALRKLQGTRGIVFDMRGYPRAGFDVVAHVNRAGNPVASQFYQPQLLAGWSVRLHVIQRLEPPASQVYTNPTVMLIDERAQSAAEHLGLWLKAANGTKFIGSPTAGANGTVARVTLPGGLTVRFTGTDARHANGAQLQRVGLIPDIEVRPTIQGVRAGRDEVLERATAFLKTGK